MVVKDGKTYYWCDKHKYSLSGIQGMYVFHKPTDHDAWLERKTALNGRCGGKGGKEKPTTPTSASTPKPSLTPGAAKLSLAKSLWEALMTTIGLTDDQFTKTWENCCSALGN